MIYNKNTFFLEVFETLVVFVFDEENHVATNIVGGNIIMLGGKGAFEPQNKKKKKMGKGWSGEGVKLNT